ncbi:ribonuclease H [Trifolium pratense]|uniref:Ribonuclease H n=1 Tax=Trifolium pratense TaxID=57577 RepID=A0A2K3MYD2_TRIPR|nr:ribonuclease H [Trifolium pratense]
MMSSIPKSCLHEIEKIQRAFIWGDSEEGRKAHMIGWNQVTLPKDLGGWETEVYGPKCFACWGIGNGTQISFWEDVWIDKKLRLRQVVETIPDDKRDWRLCNAVTEAGTWNYEELEQFLPGNLIMKLVFQMPPHADNGPDVPLWPGERMGNFSVATAYQQDLDWDAVWATTCYWRNQRVHETNYTSQWKPWSFILNLVNEYKNTKHARETEQHCQKELKDIRWICPARGWVCLNTDGNTSAYMAEVWGLYEGLSMARNLGLERLEVQVDSEVLVKVTKKDGTGCTMSWNIMKKIRDLLLELDCEVRIKHIFREGNRCADALANMGCNQDVAWMTYQEPPFELLQVLTDDFRGVSFPRLVSV